MVNNLPARTGDWVQSLGQEDPLEEGMANKKQVNLVLGNGDQGKGRGYNIVIKNSTIMHNFSTEKIFAVVSYGLN